MFVDLCLIWGMWGGSRFSLGTSFALALFGPVTFALTVLPIAAFNGITTPNAGYGLVFALTEVILLGIAIGCADRDESQDSGMPSGAINRPHSTP